MSFKLINFNMNILKSTRMFVSNLMKSATISLKRDQSGSTGNAGAIREAGGAFGKMGAAKEAEYFYKKQAEQLRQLSHKDVTSKEFQENELGSFKNKK